MRIALFEPDIPQNSGNILRLGACLGITIDIIGPTGFVFEDKKFRRAAMDYIDLVKYRKHLDWDSFYSWCNEKKYRLILFTTKSSKKFIDFKFKHEDILIFGRESSGVPKFLHDSVDERLTIPMVPGVRSINLSSSVAIVAGEACRQLNLF